ncbi:MAG: YdcF family protein, partial [Sandaracinus sp.]
MIAVWVALLVLSQLALYLSALAVGLDWKGRRPVPEDARFDAVVVLGCRVRPDGAATPTLVRRVEEGARLVLAGRAPRLVIAGGKVGGDVSEARAALPHALSLGLAEDRVTLEERSRTTDENAREVAALLANRELALLVVTDAYHVPRSVRLFRRHFSRVAGHGVVGGGLARVKNALREAAVMVA